MAQYKGMWHAMHQANWTDWAHLVSTDLVRWTRLKSALAPNGDWDGALTIMPDGKPVILFDCYNVPDCNGSVHTSRSAAKPVPNDHPLVGVAHPADLSDPNLTAWTKDPRNPIALYDLKGARVTRGFAGPSNIFNAPDGPSFVMQLGNSIARMRLAEPTMHNWTVADPAFYPSAGHGGHGASGLAFYPLPPTQNGSTTGGSDTFLGNLWVNGQAAGLQFIVLGQYLANGTFAPAGPAQRIDANDLVIFGSMQCGGGGNASSGQYRCLHIGWYGYGSGSLTLPRELTYEDSPLTGARMLAYPVRELAGLRTKSIGAITPATPVEPGKSVRAFDEANPSRTFDLLAEIGLPDTDAIIIELAILAANSSAADVTLTLNVSQQLDGVSRVDASVTSPCVLKEPRCNATIAFNSTLRGKRTLPVRVLADKTIVEIFVDNGRGVLTSAVPTPFKSPAESGNVVFVGQPQGGRAYSVSVQAWEMGCGWTAYP